MENYGHSILVAFAVAHDNLDARLAKEQSNQGMAPFAAAPRERRVPHQLLRDGTMAREKRHPANTSLPT